MTSSLSPNDPAGTRLQARRLSDRLLQRLWRAGTVVGMIEAYHVIAFNGGMGDASLLPGGISKALVDTAAGLSVALHHVLRHRLTVAALALGTGAGR